MRTFTESEARAVFAHAAREQQAATEAEGAPGLTLDELQEIGRASGLDPARVAAAARALALGEPDVGRESVGPVPTSVRRTVPLDAPPSAALWERLVADARRTFGAQGRVEAVGAEREWRNGNLRMTLAPAADGSRLHLQTRRSDAAPVVRLSAAFATVGVLVAAVNMSTGGLGAWGPGLVVVLLSVLFGGATWARQHAWASKREDQMRGIAERAAAAVARDDAGASVAAPVAPPLDLGAFDEAPDEDAPTLAPRRTRA